MAAPSITIQRSPASMTVDANGNWVFTLDCGHNVSLAGSPFQAIAQPQFSCATCANLVASGQPIPNP